MSSTVKRQLLAFTLSGLATGAAAARAASVCGVVRAGGKSVEQGRVTLFVPSLDPFLETRTQSDGSYTLEEVAAGVYRLGVAAPGYQYEEIEIIVVRTPVVHNFALKQESHPGAWD